MRKKKGPQQAIGLDIGSHSIKYVELTPDPEKIKVTHASITPLPDASPEALKAALKELFKKAQGIKIKKARALYPGVRIAISGPSLLIRKITLPLMSRLELKGAIRFEAESHVPFPIDDCILDFEILSEVPSEKIMHVLLVAAKRDFIETRLRLLAEANVYPQAVDVDIFSLSNAIEVINKGQSEKLFGILNIGHETSLFSIMLNQQPFFVREVSIGGLELTKNLAAGKGISLEEAETFKKEAPEAAYPELKTAMQQSFESLADELKNSISYFEEEHSESLSSIWLAGGGSLSPLLKETLTEMLGKPVILSAPTANVELDENARDLLSGKNFTQFLVALGMAVSRRDSK